MELGIVKVGEVCKGGKGPHVCWVVSDIPRPPNIYLQSVFLGSIFALSGGLWMSVFLRNPGFLAIPSPLGSL